MSQTVPTRFQETRYLVLNDRIIDEVVAAKLTLGEVTKYPQNPLFGEDRPWEPRFDNVYANVIYDSEDKLYKCWYNPFIIDERVTHTPAEKRHPDWCNYMDVKPNHREMGLCYAFSTDGIHWEKPELELIEFDGSKQNNIVMRGVNGAGDGYFFNWRDGYLALATNKGDLEGSSPFLNTCEKCYLQHRLLDL